MGEDERVAALIGEWCDRQHRGDAGDPEELIRENPELSNALREGFSAIELIDLAFSPQAAARLPDRIGDFRILEELGTGGMGTVYLAAAESTSASLAPSQRVALKLLHPHLLERHGFFKRFLREAEMGRQVDHENVVRTIDADAVRTDGETHFVLVMEYVEGRTLRRLLDDLGTVPEVLVREIALQAAAGLAAIHEAGIVHRDIKPENLLITDDHRVRIMDLGIARDIESSGALTRDGEFVGSLAYAAPEQFGESGAGPAADLYSLGVVLYELATGVNPFRRDSIPEAIAAHLKEAPRPATDIQPDLSLYLSELLRSLLAKDPAERHASAAALHETLRLAESSTWWIEREQTVGAKVARLPRIPVRRDTELYGRDEDLALLHDAWERAARGDGSVVFLEGEAGIGKTRLVDTLVQSLGAQDAAVLYGSYPPGGGMGGLSDAVLDHFGASRLRDALAPFVAPTPSLVPAFAALLRHESPPDGSAPLQGDALHAVFCHLLRGLAEERPVLWVVDDLHFAAAESRGIVLSLARAVAGQRVLLVVTSRRGVPEGELAHFGRLRHLRRCALRRLGAREVIELLRDAFRSEALAVKLGGRIALKSDGVPFFVFEMMRGLAEGQFITELPDGTWVETRVVERIDVPSAVRDLIEARLGDLSSGERAILDVGAVQGYEFDPDLVARVLQLPRISVLQDLAAIERRLGVVRGRERACRFDHHQLQEVIHQDLTPDLRCEYHVLLAEALAAREGAAEKEPGDVDGALAARLCDHYLQGGRGESGVVYLDTALAHLAASYQHEAAVVLARRALGIESLARPAERVALLLRVAEYVNHVGRREGMRVLLDEAHELAGRLGDDRARAEALRLLGVYHFKAARYDDAEAALSEAIELATAIDDGAIVASSRGTLGNVLMAAGRTDDALTTLQRGLQQAHDLRERRLEARISVNLADVLDSQGRFEEALALIARHAPLARQVGDRQAEASGELTAGNVLYRRGHHEEAQRRFERSRDISRQIGDRNGESSAIGNLGNALFDQGRYDEGRAQYETQLAICLEIGDRKGETISTGNLATTFKDLGRYGQARAYQQRHLALARELGYRRGEAIALLNLGELSMALGDLSVARDSLAQAEAISRDIGTRWLDSHVLGVRAGLAEHEGDDEAARRLYDESLVLLREFDLLGEVARVQIGAGALALRRGEEDDARRRLREAVELAERLDEPEVLFEAAAVRAALPGHGPEPSLAAFRRVGARMAAPDLMRGWLRLWQATREPAHLAEAHRLLTELREHAPEEFRDSMITNVPLHRDIIAAWREHGGSESETAVST